MEDWEPTDSQPETPTLFPDDKAWPSGNQDDCDWMDDDVSEAEPELEGACPEADTGRREGLGAEMTGVSEDEVYAQLAQKEQDLMLAAELGKALLEKNQELEEQVARLTEDFSQKLEVLEQERHSLQSQLTQRQAEYGSTIRDLQDDISNLQEQLRHHDDETSAGQRRHVQDLRKLQQLNESLSEQLRQSLAQQQALSAEAGQLREQLTSRRSTLRQRVDHVDQLEDEAEYLRQRHQELEVQIRQVKEERDALTTELENLHERLLLLEKQRQLQDEQLHHQHTELQELRDTNSVLQSQLQQLTSSHQASGDSPTLFNELSHLNDLNISPPTSFIQFHTGERVSCLSADMLEEDDFEYDDDIFCDVMTHSSPIPCDMGLTDANKSVCSLQDELMSDQVPAMEEAGGETEEGGATGGGCGGGQTRVTSSLRPVTLTEELRDLLKDMQYSDDEDAEDGGSRQAKADNSSQQEMAERHVTEMTYGPGRHYQGGEGKEEGEEEEEEGESTSTLSRQSQHYFNDMFQAQQSRIEKLERRVQELECRVQELQQERDRLQNAACGEVTAGHVLQQTRCERDNAMGRISDMERELSRLTGEVVTLNGQLMDTIRRKVMISQELDQWQVDLSEVLAVQMQRRMKEQQKVEQAIGQLKKTDKSLMTAFEKQNR